MRNAFRKLHLFYAHHNPPAKQVIEAAVAKFHSSFTSLDICPPTHMRGGRTEEHIGSIIGLVLFNHQDDFS